MGNFGVSPKQSSKRSFYLGLWLEYYIYAAWVVSLWSRTQISNIHNNLLSIFVLLLGILKRYVLIWVISGATDEMLITKTQPFWMSLCSIITIYFYLWVNNWTNKHRHEYSRINYVIFELLNQIHTVFYLHERKNFNRIFKLDHLNSIGVEYHENMMKFE